MKLVNSNYWTDLFGAVEYGPPILLNFILSAVEGYRIEDPQGHFMRVSFGMSLKAFTVALAASQVGFTAQVEVPDSPVEAYGKEFYTVVLDLEQ